jgi:hypothetical protein
MPKQFDGPHERAGLTRRRLLEAAGATAATAIAAPLRSKVARGYPLAVADRFALDVPPAIRLPMVLSTRLALI